MYGFSTFGTVRSGGLQGDKVLVRGSIVECGMGAFVVVEERIVGQCGLHRADVAVPELDAGAAVGTFHTAVVLGALRWQHMQRDVQRLTGRLEAGHELAAAVDLDGDEREWQRIQQLAQEALCMVGSRPCADARDHELRHRAHGAELLDGIAVSHIRHVIDLHQLARGTRLRTVLPAPCPAGKAAPALRRMPAFAQRGGPDHPAGQRLAAQKRRRALPQGLPAHRLKAQGSSLR